MVPELDKDQTFSLASRKPIEEYLEARALGYQTRPVLVGPVTFLKLAKCKDTGFNTLVVARPAAAGLHRSPARTRQGRRGMGADRRTLPRARPRYRRTAGAAPHLHGNRQGGAADQDHAGDLFRRPWRQPRHRAGAAGRRAASRPRARARATRRARQPAERPRAVARHHRRPQHLARRSQPDPRPAGTRRRQTGRRPRAARAVMFAVACPDRSGAGDQPRSRREKLAGLLGAEDRGTGGARHRAGAGPRPRRDDPESLR